MTTKTRAAVAAVVRAAVAAVVRAAVAAVVRSAAPAASCGTGSSPLSACTSASASRSRGGTANAASASRSRSGTANAASGSACRASTAGTPSVAARTSGATRSTVTAGRTTSAVSGAARSTSSSHAPRSTAAHEQKHCHRTTNGPELAHFPFHELPRKATTMPTRWPTIRGPTDDGSHVMGTPFQLSGHCPDTVYAQTRRIPGPRCGRRSGHDSIRDWRRRWRSWRSGRRWGSPGRAEILANVGKRFGNPMTLASGARAKYTLNPTVVGDHVADARAFVDVDDPSVTVSRASCCVH